MKEEPLLLLSDLQKLINQVVLIDYTIIILGGEKMEAIPRDYGEQCRFDAFCKTVLQNEARNYHRDMKRQRVRETSFSVLTQAELDKLYTVDHYPSDDFVFSSHG